MKTIPATSHLLTSFRRIGASARVVAPLPADRKRPWLASLNAQRVRVLGDLFEVVLPDRASAAVLDCRTDERHLVLSVQAPGAATEKFLCGFDERHWFAASVKGSSVLAAKESLLPAEVREVALRSGVRHAQLFRRHNRAFIRQGEWFFVPTDLAVNPLTVHRREPLVRPGGGKPHVVDELVRGYGEVLWFHPKHAPHGGLTPAEHAALDDYTRQLPAWTRRVRVHNGTVLARGAVRHPDHATIHLRGWHRVFINSEQRTDSLGFYD